MGNLVNLGSTGKLDNLIECKTNDSPNKNRMRSPMIKRTTILRGMGKFCKVTNRKLIINALTTNLMGNEVWTNDFNKVNKYLIHGKY